MPPRAPEPIRPSLATETAAPAAAFREICQAMVTGDTSALSVLLDDRFQLTHMTGRVQPKKAWLADIDSGRMAYHALKEVSVSVQAHGNQMTVTGRQSVDATIYGGRAIWSLQLVTVFERRQGGWLATDMVASTF